MRKLSRFVVICLVILMVLNIASVSHAQNMGRKLFRGVINMASGWIELPKNIYDYAMEYDFASAMFAKFPQGCWMSVVRTAAGAYDVLTFPLPVPKNYEPILKPEFVVDGK